MGKKRMKRHIKCLISIIMIIMLAILAALYLTGAVVIAIGVFTAPEGYQDESGFHIVWQNNSPEVADVACIWETRQFAIA